MRTRSGLGASLLLTALLAVVSAACSHRSPSSSTPPASSVSTLGRPAPSSGVTTSTTLGPVRPPAPSTSAAPNASTVQVTLPARVDVHGGIVLQIVSHVAIQAQPHGPGEIAGPAVLVTLAVTNNGTVARALSGVDVTASYGAAHTPASSVDVSQTVYLHGDIAPGRTVTGTYAFLIPLDQRTDVTLELTFGEGFAVVQARGSLA